MQHPRSPAAGADVRRLVLGAVFAAGVAFALAPHTLAVRAANLHGDVIAQADTPKAAKAPAPATPPAAGKTKQPDADAAAKGGAGNDADTDSSDDDAANAADENTAKATPRSGNHGIFIQKGDKKITIEGLGGEDREFDSFEEFVRKAPRIAVMFFITLMVLFLLPLLIVVLLVWYKLRKNRLANETMLKLAERGVVPPAAAMDAVASGTAASVASASASTSGRCSTTARQTASASSFFSSASATACCGSSRTARRRTRATRRRRPETRDARRSDPPMRCGPPCMNRSAIANCPRRSGTRTPPSPSA